MVRYTGRCKTITGAVNTNQVGLKLSGSSSSVGARARYTKNRVTDNVKVCGPNYRHGVIWSFNGPHNSICVPPASKCQGIAGGVGRVNAPRFNCTKSFEHQLETEQVPQTGHIFGGGTIVRPAWTYGKGTEKPRGLCNDQGLQTLCYTQEPQNRLKVDKYGNQVIDSSHGPVFGGKDGLGPSWTWDDKTEKPRGICTEDNEYTTTFYTREQQKRLRVNRDGSPAIVGGGGGTGPRWTWDTEFEQPTGIRVEGSYTIYHYTEEQQIRLQVNSVGNPVIDSSDGPMFGGKDGLGPRWTWDNKFEKPRGTCKDDEITTYHYTKDQQKRLEVDRNGHSTTGISEKGFFWR